MKNEQAKLLNKLVTGNKFEDKDTEKYLYASLSQPPIEIIDKCNSTDELDFIVKCPNCKCNVCYGTDIFSKSGYLYCSNKGCREKLMKILGDKNE